MENNVRPLGPVSIRRLPTLASCPDVQQAARTALLDVKTELGCSLADIAKWCRCSKRTVERWLAGTNDVNINLVANSQRLYPRFNQRFAELTRPQAA